MGDNAQALASLTSDLNKHEGTRDSVFIARDLGTRLMASGHLSTPQKMREFVEGFA